MPRDIEEFLKMAAKRRQQQKKQGGRPATPAGGGAQRPQTPPPQAQRRSIRPATDDEIVIIGGPESASRQPAGGTSVADHVRSHIDTSALGEHARHLGEKVALADDKLDARLQSTFDHDVGNLKIDTSQSAFATTTTTTAKTVSPIASDLLDMLSNPKSIRQAILINEILQRPKFD